MKPLDQSTVDKHTGKTRDLGPELHAHIGRQLCSLYEEVLNEPVPEHLRELLAELGSKSYGLSGSTQGRLLRASPITAPSRARAPSSGLSGSWPAVPIDSVVRMRIGDGGHRADRSM